jgi:uncharacterized protein
MWQRGFSMSKENEDLIKREQAIDDELDSVVVRHPRSKIPVLPFIILFFIYLMFGFAKTYQKSEQSQQALNPFAEINSSTNEQVETHSVNLHHLITAGAIKDIEEQIYSVDREAINEVVNGMTPIMLAASQGSVEIIDLLFTQGAEPNKRGSAQRTALQYAVEKNHIEAAKRLLAYGADIDAFDNGRLTPLIMAADRGYTELGLLLLEKGADPNSQHSQGWTALIDAARNGDETLVNALLEAGADKGASMENGMTARDMAKRNGHKDIVNILID